MGERPNVNRDNNIFAKKERGERRLRDPEYLYFGINFEVRIPILQDGGGGC